MEDENRQVSESQKPAPWLQAFYALAAKQEEKRVERQGYAFILLGIGVIIFSSIFPKHSTADYATCIGFISNLIGLQRLYRSETIKRQGVAAYRAVKKDS